MLWMLGWVLAMHAPAPLLFSIVMYLMLSATVLVSAFVTLCAREPTPTLYDSQVQSGVYACSRHLMDMVLTGFVAFQHIGALLIVIK